MENIIASILAVAGLLEIYLLIYLVSCSRAARRKPFVKGLEKLNIFLALFFVMTLGAFTFLNGPAYAENLSFDLRSAFGGNQQDADRITDDPIVNLSGQDAATGTVAVPPAGTPLVLSIPKLNVRAPIVFSSDPSTKGVLKSLESGVGVFPGSALPGQKGHMIILGHSSRASWYNGDYARVFALLEKLQTGDEFVIEAGSTKYVYKIFSNQVFKPAALDAYLAQPVSGNVVVLVTCHPVGSARDRTAVSAALQTAGQ